MAGFQGDPQVELKSERRGFFSTLGVLFAPLVTRHKRAAVFILFCAISSGALQTYAPQVLQQIIDGFAKGSFATPMGMGDFQTLLFYFIAAAVFGLVFRTLSEKTSFYLATQLEDFWRFRTLRAYYALPIAWHDTQDSGEVAARIDRGGGAVYTIIYELFGQWFFVDFITLLFVLPLAYRTGAQFFWVLFLPIPILATVTYFISSRVAEAQRKLNELEKVANKALFDGAMNVRTVKAFGKEVVESGKYETSWSRYHLYEYGLQGYFFLQSVIYTLFDIGTRGVLLFFGLYALLGSQFTVGQIVLLLSLQQLVFFPITRLNMIFTRIRRQVNRAKILLSIVEESEAANASPRPLQLGRLGDGIEFRGVSFSYGGKTRAVRDLNFAIRRGSTVALVGRSGAGKTTIAALIAGFYTPTDGAILWDGQDLRKASRGSIARQVSYVAQDSSLFNRSIRANIAYSNERAQDEEVEDASMQAHAHEFILGTPRGYRSVIGERGVRLSGGQRQRLALARSLLAKGSLLILDESTSQLDSESERAIQGAIKGLRGSVTQVIIAHRLSTVLHADKILVMEKGRLVASGTHRELLKGSPVYRRLYDLQFQD